MDTLLQFVNLVLHIDKFLGVFIQQYGAWVYAVLFLIVFCETGLVVLPFLPGDSLLFIGGAFCATGEMNLGLLIVLLLVAAVGGNTLNYLIGKAIGPKVFNTHIPVLERFLDREALQKTHNFYEKHGGKTIVLARFIPVVRTFAPFVAGASEMTVSRFQLFNFVGALFWVLLLVLLGYFFGNIPFIRQYLNVIVLVGIGAAIVPLLLGALVEDAAQAGCCQAWTWQQPVSLASNRLGLACSNPGRQKRRREIFARRFFVFEDQLARWSRLAAAYRCASPASAQGDACACQFAARRTSGVSGVG